MQVLHSSECGLQAQSRLREVREGPARRLLAQRVSAQWGSVQSPRRLAAESGPTPMVSELFGLGWGLRICVSEFPGDAAAATAGLGTTL